MGVQDTICKIVRRFSNPAIGFALLAGKTARQPLAVYFHATNFVIAPIHLQISLALSSAGFALTYFASARWLPIH